MIHKEKRFYNFDFFTALSTQKTYICDLFLKLNSAHEEY